MALWHVCCTLTDVARKVHTKFCQPGQAPGVSKLLQPAMAGHALWTQYEARRYSLHCSPCWSERQDLKQPQPRDSQHLEAFWKQETAVRGAGSLCAD